MKKKYVKFILCCLVLVLIMNINSYSVHGLPFNVDAKCAVAIDSKSKMVLYEKNANLTVPIASTTKIMTALVALNYGDLDKKIPVSSKAANIRGSRVGLRKGEELTIRELLYGLMLRSGNDAAITIAEGIGGSVENFANLMNEFALELGCCNSHFESPHGLDSQYHYSTAYDLALITAAAKENKLFNQIVSTKDIDSKTYGFSRSYHNINKILYQIPKANGVKTGYTGKAGKCLVTSIDCSNDDVIIVVLNCYPRWKETKKIYEYVRDNYEFKKMIKKDDLIDILQVNNNEIELVSSEDIIIPINKTSSYEMQTIKPQKVELPIKKDDLIGELCIYKDGKVINRICLKANKSLKTNKEKFFHRLFSK